MHSLKVLAFALFTALVLLVLFGLALPAEQTIQRAIVVQRPAATVYTVLDGFRWYVDWQPVPQATGIEIDGPIAGVGAKLSRGSTLKIKQIAAVQDRSLKFEQAEGRQQVMRSFDLIDAPGGVQLSITDDLAVGRNIAERYRLMFADRWHGARQEAELTRIAAVMERLPLDDFRGLEVDLVEVAPQTVVYVSGDVTSEPAAIIAEFETAAEDLRTYIAVNNLSWTGEPMAVNKGIANGRFQFEFAIPVDRVITANPGSDKRVNFGKTYSGRAVRVKHVGPYEQVASVYAKANAYLAAHRFKPVSNTWEQYRSDPRATPTNQLTTFVFIPIDR
jgi:effector-binding domain-containing protein